MKPAANRAEQSLAARLRGPVLTAILLMAGFFVGLGGWSATAPLTSAAVAPGSVGLETRRTQVQHLEGGIVAELRVKEGDRVAEGDLMVLLDDTIARSTLDILQGQYIDLLALRARLIAERDGATALTMPRALVPLMDVPRTSQAMAAQGALFERRRDAYDSRVEILKSKLRQLDEQIRGFDAQRVALEQQVDLIRKERDNVQEMVDRGLERSPRLYSLQREEAGIDGVLGDIAARRSQVEVLIGETRLELLDLDARLQNQIAGELSDLAGRIADMRPRLDAAEDRLARTRIRAPVAGTVVGLGQFAPGSVLGAGQPILDIVPADMELMIEARVSTTEIDVVRAGLPAEVRLVAFSARKTPTVPGKVVHVSADRLIDQATGLPYYAVYVRLDAEAMQATPEIDMSELYPGMPVEVMVVTGQQTVLDYMLQPITDALARAFRET